MEDVLIIGAGIFGLSLARKYVARGRGVLVVDAQEVGAGASATPLGVLAPHAPDRWNEKKQMQFEALRSLPGYLADLEQETGCAVGYRRCGRLIPLTQPHHPDLWRARASDASRHWQGFARIDICNGLGDGWLSRDAAPFGAASCGLTARIDARGYLRALAASVGAARLAGGLRLMRFEGNRAVFHDGRTIAARDIVLATGAATYGFMPALQDGSPAGRAEKGQAARLRLDMAGFSEQPIIFSDGTYVVPRDDGSVAVGATSEREFEDPGSTDVLLDERISKARLLCPRLSQAPVIERWAGLRPRSADRRATFRRHPDNSNVLVATGGFKTGLALAHTLMPPRDAG